MPQLLFDVYMAEKFSHLFSLYVREREATTMKDPILSSKKKDKVGRELEQCREIQTSTSAERSSEPWDAHLEKFKHECVNLVTSYDNSQNPVNSHGALVNDFIVEATHLLKDARTVFMLFGLEKAKMDEMNYEIYSRLTLLNLCMSRLYYPHAMRTADWEKMQAFCTHMTGACEVSLGEEKTSIPSFKAYAPLEVAAKIWLKKEEAALKIEPLASEQNDVASKNDTSSLLSNTQSAVAYAGSYLFSKVSGSLSEMLGGSSSSSSAVPVLTLSPSALRQNSNTESSSVHSEQSRDRSSSISSTRSTSSTSSANLKH
ncbi:MAG: hypothetical protein ACHQAX_07265 [Gammaproteobacteria bacterium]